MSREKNKFQLFFPENQKINTDLSVTRKLSYDGVADFEEERKKIERTIDQDLETNLRIDYSQFSNHIFFGSALSAFNVAKDRVLTKYPFNGTLEEKEAFILTGSGYDEYVFNQWPRYVGYLDFDGVDQYVTASDPKNILLLGTSSLYVSAWIDPTIADFNIILQFMSASVGGGTKQGYDLYLSGATDPHVVVSMYSGSQKVSVSASYMEYTGSFNNVAAMYNQSEDLLSLYVNNSKKASSSISFGSLEYYPSTFVVGSGSQYTTASSSFEFYSGSIDEIRVLHTASELWHLKNYSRPIDADSYVKLNYTCNDSVVGTGSVDRIIIDYSKSGLHGTYLNYDNSKTSGSVMTSDPGNPILYSYHSDLMTFTASAQLSATLYDNDNNNFIYNLMPSDLLIEDENEEGLLQAFALSMARYFDDIKLYIDQLDNLRITNYSKYDEVPDQFLYYATKYFGWEIAKHYIDAEPLSFYFGENVLDGTSGSLDTPLLEIKNQFWRRMLSNLPYIIQSKGKKNSIDAFLNVLGIGKGNVFLKEFGYLPEGSIDNSRVYSEKPVPMLGIGTGSQGTISSSFVKASDLIATPLSQYTIETHTQLPYFSASYSGSQLTGTIWQLVDPEEVTGSFTLLWVRDSFKSSDGKFILTSSDGQSYATSTETLFDGDMTFIAAGLNAESKPFVELRTIDNDEIDFSASYVGTTAFSGVFTGSNFDFIMGANSGSAYFTYDTQGFYGEYRFWSRALSASELDDHANHYSSVGITDPQETPNPLVGHWALDENNASDSNGVVSNILDYSRNGNTATGREFPTSENPYQKFLLQYNFLSPSLDLKWMENKIRVRNKTELSYFEVANDTNEVAVEFNLVDSLNEDISKIFSTFDVINNTIGHPVHKYRDEYVELEDLRKVYFDRLEDSLHFTSFFRMFRWFDKKLSESIKQLLPARVKFIGGEQVVESHFLERPKVGFKYDLFFDRSALEKGKVNFIEPSFVGRYSKIFINPRNPDNVYLQKDNGDIVIKPVDSILPGFDGEKSIALNMASENSLGTAAREKYDRISQLRRNNNSSAQVPERTECHVVEGFKNSETVSAFVQGDDIDIKIIKGLPDIHFHKYSGDQRDEINTPNSAINFRNPVSRKTLEGIEKAPFANKKLGNLYRFNNMDSSKDNEHYFYGHPNYVSEVFTASMDTSWYDTTDFLTGSSGSDEPAKVFYAVTTAGITALKDVGNADVDILYVNRKVARNVED